MNHELYMQRCLDIAANGLRAAMPNPCVGAVLIYNNTIIGEGYTSAYGGPHGEVNCINSVLPHNRHLIPLATLYVSLEPCSHYGKTPPCCDLVIQHSINTIVIGTTDPNPLVAGNGIKKLQKAGKTVITGILEKECREFNRRFFTFYEKKRPYIILKWAESADGFLSPSDRLLNNSNIRLLDNSTARSSEDLNSISSDILEDRNVKNLKIQTNPDLDNRRIGQSNNPIIEKKPVWITNPYSRQLVHKWRSEEMAILAGTQTVIDDNPKLDVRDWTGLNPVRVVLDRTGRINDSYFVKNGKIKTIILTGHTNFHNLDNLVYEQVSFDQNLPFAIAGILYKYGLQSVIIEGGLQTLQTFINAGLWDEARVFKGTVSFAEGTHAPQLTGKLTAKEQLLDDELLNFRNYG